MRLWILVSLWLTGQAVAAECSARYHADMVRLAEQVQQWDQAYHEQGRSLVTEDIYDQARLQLQRWQQCSDAPLAEYHPAPGTQPHPVAQTGLDKA